VTAVTASKEAPADGSKALPEIGVSMPQPQALADLQAALDSMDRAGRAAGVEPDEALGAWIATLKVALECSATVVLAGEARIQAAIAALESAAREDRLRMRQATDRCTAETLKLERTFGTMEVRAHNLVTQTIHSMADQVAAKMRDRMVIVERQHNRIAVWRRAGVLAMAVVTIFGVGFAVARYNDSNAVDLLARCLAHPFVDTQTGGLVCEVGSARPGA